MFLSRVILLVIFSLPFSFVPAESCGIKDGTTEEAKSKPSNQKLPLVKQVSSKSNSAKPTILVVHRETCPHCRHLMQEVFSSFDSNSKKYGLEGDYNVQFLDTDKLSDFNTYSTMVKNHKLIENVNGVPAVIILSSGGQESNTGCRIIGYNDSESFFNSLQSKLKSCS